MCMLKGNQNSGVSDGSYCSTWSSQVYAARVRARNFVWEIAERFITGNICKQLKTPWLSASVGGQQ